MVNVGGIVDPFSGLQRGLSGIAQTFGAQADAEAREKARLDNLALDRAAAEESSRRFEQTRADSLAAQKREDEYRIGRDAKQDARIAKQDAIKEEDRNKLLAKENAVKTLDKFTNTYDFNKKYKLEDYSPEQIKLFSKLKTTLDNEEVETRKFLTTGGDINNVLNAYKTRLDTSNLPQSRKNELLAERKNRLLSLTDELAGKGYTDDKLLETIDNRVNALYQGDRNRIDETIQSGSGLAQREQLNAFIKDLPQEVRDNISRGDIQTRLAQAGILTASSRGDLIASDKQQAAAANELAVKQIELTDKYYTRLNAGKSSKGFTSSRKPEDVIKALKEVGNLDIGPLDNKAARDALSFLLEDKDVNPQAAAAAILAAVEESPVGSSFSNSAKSLAALKQSAKAMSPSSSFGSGRVSPKKSEYEITPATPRGIEELLTRNIRFAGRPSQQLEVDDRFNRSIIAAAQEADAKAKAEAESTLPASNTDTTSTTTPGKGDLAAILASDPVSAIPLQDRYTTRGRSRLPTPAMRDALLQRDRIDEYNDLMNTIGRNNRTLTKEQSFNPTFRTPSIQRNAEANIAEANRRLAELRAALLPQQ